MGYKYLNAVLLSDKLRVKLTPYDLQLTTPSKQIPTNTRIIL